MFLDSNTGLPGSELSIIKRPYPAFRAPAYSSTSSQDKISTSTRFNVRFRQGKASRSTSASTNGSFCLNAITKLDNPFLQYMSSCGQAPPHQRFKSESE